MKKILILLSFILMSCTFSLKNAEANDYNTAVLGHILTETIKGTDIDHGEIFSAETQKQIHNMSLQVIQVIFNNMPNILDGISADGFMSAGLKPQASGGGSRREMPLAEVQGTGKNYGGLLG